MPVRPILLYPASVLKRPAAAASLADPAVPGIIQDLVDTVRASPGVALAAPQIGHGLRIIVVDVSRKQGERGHGLVILLNPTIIAQEGSRLIREGCLSVPDYTGNVRRHEQALVDGTTPDGQSVVLSTIGFEALAFQHEIDHLNGVLFLDRIDSLATDLFRRKGSVG